MSLLLDTHIFKWAAAEPYKLSPQAVTLINDNNWLYFSAASLWQVVIKNGIGRPDCQIDPHLLSRGLADDVYLELPILSKHTLAVSHLPDIHKDPFNRILNAQAKTEGFLLLTADELVAR